MGAGSRFYFKPAEGEHIETEIHIDEEKRSAIFGTVHGNDKKAVEDAMAVLFRADDPDTPVTYQFTDTEGHFCFGPVESGVLYLVKIFKNSEKIRELEITAK